MNVFLKTAAAAAAASLALVFGAAQAALISTAVVHIGVDDTGNFGIDNIVNFLGGDARFSGVGEIDVDARGVPTLGDLSGFDSVLIVTDNRAGNLTGGGLGTQVGNILDDYVTAGGRVVFSTFSGNTDIGVDGDILALAPFTPTGFNDTAGTLNLAGAMPSFVFDGVSTFDSSFASEVALSAAGILLAAYDSGAIGVATTLDDSVMLVNAFPAMQADYAGSDFGLLFANALAGPSDMRAVPIPAALPLMLSGLAGLGLLRRRKKTV